MAKYTFAFSFTKKTNLLPYLNTLSKSRGSGEWEKKKYGREQDVQLVAMFRMENGKYLCRIKCPINPLPIKGEFEAPSALAVIRFLKANGWEYEGPIDTFMFD
jgi:hypothetical protein